MENFIVLKDNIINLNDISYVQILRDSKEKIIGIRIKFSADSNRLLFEDKKNIKDICDYFYIKD